MLDFTKNDGFKDGAAKSKALAVFEAATALIETRLSAIRQCAEVDDTQVVIDTEALAARAAAWRAEVEEAIRIVEEATDIANAETMLSLAEKRHYEVVREWTPQISQMEEIVKRVERDGGEELAAVMKAGFKKDPIFAHLVRMNSKHPEKRFSFSDRLIAKWAKFGEELAKYERTDAYVGERNEWLANARKAISEANATIEASRREYNEASRDARTLRDEAASVVERGWKTLVDLLAEGAPEFAELDLDAACGVAREAAAAGVRNGCVVVPFAAEQDERLAELDARRVELKRHLERIAAIA
ncbi:hypothetical protein OIU34_18370 [Pararhizobium sp. BT-229]|uniref:hypothetical protein n=1 Tax=Pararhizobium sp. BT-229 TaxID=2986923 RepID=UPI0021F7252B|nr:hypothetical protein [Pararhizobium sp. BT-229]MCV9963845.1 hypothetical protein [Pararhizobium sp. BT-229]